MGFEKKFRPELAYAEADRVQALTGASTGTTINAYGITTIVVTTGEGTAANLIYSLASPLRAGMGKIIYADLNSTKEVQVRTASSAGTFFGSTKNSFTFSTGSTAPPSSIHLRGISTSQWAVEAVNTPLATITVVSTAGGTASIDHNVTIAGATA